MKFGYIKEIIYSSQFGYNIFIALGTPDIMVHVHCTLGDSECATVYTEVSAHLHNPMSHTWTIATKFNQ